MIIEAKSTKLTAEPVDGRKRYESKSPERLSRVPLYFALFVTAVAAYLKSAFPAQAQALAETGEDTRKGAAEKAAVPHQLAAEAPNIDDLLDHTDAADVEDDEAGNSFGRPPAWPLNYLYPDQPALRFADMSDPGAPVRALFPVAFSYLPSNDNQSPGPIGTVEGGKRADLPVVPKGSAGGDHGEGTDDDDDAPPDDEDDEDDDTLAVNRPPVSSGPIRLHDVFAGQAVLIALSQLLQGASDPDSDPLVVMNLSVSGAATVSSGGGWSVETMPGMLGRVSFNYQVSDGTASVNQMAYFDIVRNVVALTPDDDVFAATPYDDDIDGLAGDDIIVALAGNDLVVGGAGDDHIDGGDGDDDLFGNNGDDVIAGGKGNDSISGGSGNDRLFGDEGDDVIAGDSGDDYLAGGEGSDILDGGDGKDELDGGTGDDLLVGAAGNDTLDGGEGNDGLYGDQGNDTMRGAAGTDVLQGGEGADHIDGGTEDDVLLGAAGDDILDGGDGGDSLDGGDGKDELDGGAGDDLLVGAAGDDTMHGAGGADVLDGGEGDDHVDGGTGGDLLTGGNGDDTIVAGDGDDTIVADAGDDAIDGGAGADTITFAQVDDDVIVDLIGGLLMSESLGTDNLSSIELVVGGSGDDLFIVDATIEVTLTGGKGNDLFLFQAIGEATAASTAAMHDILDFAIGDRIRVKDYGISSTPESAQQQFFSAASEDGTDDWLASELPILVRYERYDDVDHTIIQADMNRDTVFEMTIDLHGIHLPLPATYQVA